MLRGLVGSCVLCGVLLACDASEDRDAVQQDAGNDAGVSATHASLTHTFPELSVPSSFENANQCQSWTLHNDAPLWVNAVVAKNQGALHHSNWVFVPDDAYDGPDGNWQCEDRAFEQIAAAAMGGVFFAQSTQALRDEQKFPQGAAFEIPAHARIIGQVHTLNVTDDTIDTRLSFEVTTLDADQVTIPLRAMAFTNYALELPPRTKTRARMDCGVPQPDLSIYYVLPHYHSLGSTMTVSVLGGASDGEEIFRATATYGDALGKTYDPPVVLEGAEKLRIACEYDNPRDEQVGYGVGDQEMCVVLIYSNADMQGGGFASKNAKVETVDGVNVTDAPCASFAL